MRQTSDIQRFGFQQEYFFDVVVADQFPNLVDLISHEMRTPLTSLLGVLELLNSGHFGTLSEEGKHFLEIAMRSVYRLKRLADAISNEPAISMTILPSNKLTELQLENDFSSAFDRHEMRLCYQPVIAIETSEIIGFEAIAQWHHRDKGWLPPHVVIPLAEKTGLIHQLGIWSLEEACRQLQIWQQQFVRHSPLTISVNLSALQLCQNDLVEQIQRILLARNIDPRCLILKITEGDLLKNYEVEIAILSQLRTLGIQIYIDDFGIAYSLLGHLKDFPVDILKIDRTFIRDQNWIMSEVILLIAERLGLKVIAEGVETLEELRSLQALGCKQMQGYFFSQPVDRQAASLLLATMSKLQGQILPLN
ncbi:EAL domain-containing protein [Pantanalinema sp. GBBB05]|uniref:EAL domain-containing protein n=1 Tax=Pantanalinema sp. GBBB05 TaxID=2604139 RepID=UPI001DADDBCB|nr:EAL domain-containing protein [Pantanalinema sp. GBBB05]